MTHLSTLEGATQEVVLPQPSQANALTPSPDLISLA